MPAPPAKTPASPIVDPLGPSAVPPPPVIPDIPSLPSGATSKLPRLLKATYITQGETLLWETRPTRWFYLPAPVLLLGAVLLVDGLLWRTMTGSSVLSFLPALPGLGGVDPSSATGRIVEITMVVLVMVAVLYFGVRWLQYASTVYVVTSTRVIRQKGILAKDFDEVQLLQVRGVDVKQHVLQRLLGYGTVRISAEFGGTAQAMGNEDWPGVPRSIQFERTVEEAQERLRGLLPPRK